jgi:hypothetical protein
MEAKRPTIVIVAVVILIILGGFGVLGSCIGVASVAGQSSIMAMNEQLLAGAPGGAEQLEAQRELMAVQAGFTVPQIIGQLFNLLGSVILVVGAALLASLKKSAPNVLLGATGISVLADLVNAVLGLYIGYASQEAAARMVQSNPDAEQMMGAIMNATMVMTVVWAILWLLIKFGIYGLGIYASRKPEVAQVLS